MIYYTDGDLGNTGGYLDRDYDSSIESDEGDALDYFGCFDALGGYGSDGGGGTPRSIKPFATANPRVANGELLLFGISSGVDEEPIEDWIASMLAKPNGGGGKVNTENMGRSSQLSSVRSSVSSISNVQGRGSEAAGPSPVAEVDGNRPYDDPHQPVNSLTIAAATTSSSSSSSSSRPPSRSQRFTWLNHDAGNGEGLANASDVRLHSLLLLHVCAHVEFCPLALEKGVLRIIRVIEHVEKVADRTDDNNGGNLACR